MQYSSFGGDVWRALYSTIFIIEMPGCPPFLSPYMNRRKLTQAVCLLTCFLMMMSIAVLRGSKLFGHDLTATARPSPASPDTATRISPDGATVINTSTLGAELSGYGGPVPIEVFVRDGRIERIEVLPNSETPAFLEAVTDELPARWIGRTVSEADTMAVDVVSGATFTSRALIGNVRLAARYAADHSAAPSLWDALDLSPKALIALLVVLMAAVLPLFIRNRTYHTLQLLLNVGVLGFWSGSFLSYSLLLGYLANGTQLLLAFVPLVMLITAFIYPLFGRPQYYCIHVCPLGSLQQLAGRVSKRKLRLGSATVRLLDRFRLVLWVALMVLLWADVAAAWVDWELFPAFLVRTAPGALVVAAGLFVALSVFIPRPYCRFVCPTGSLFKVSEGMK